VTPFHRPDASRVRGMAALALAVLAAACADAPTQSSAPAPAPLMQGSAGGFRGEWQFPIPENSVPGRLNSTPTSIVVPRAGVYRVRVQGTVMVTNNPEYPGPCDVDGTPTAALGTFGPQGFVTPFRQRVMQARVSTEPIDFQGYNLGLAAVDSQTIEREVYLAAGQQLHADWTGYPGSVSCSSPDGLGATIAYYLFSGGFTLTVTEVVQQQPATLVLECNGARGAVSVERGASLSCAARTEPAGGQVTDARWTFRDTQGDGPAITGPAGQNTWSGPMVVGGTVTLAAKVNGDEQSATAAVTVTKRAWRDVLPERRTVHCPAAGVADCPLNVPLVHDMDVGQTRVRWRILPRGRRITAGPNTGWNYFSGTEGALEFYDYFTYLNSELLNPRSRLFRGGCTQSNVTSWVIRHEDVHVGKISGYVDRNRLNPLVEEVVAYGDDAFRQARDRITARVRQMTSNLGDPKHQDNDYPPDPCNLGLRPNPS
jgi:hypothetical protein